MEEFTVSYLLEEEGEEKEHTYLPTLHLDAAGSFKKKYCKEMMA